jgi:exopolysaccharide biosynthesis WecB/TagA/CpsF family protein
MLSRGLEEIGHEARVFYLGEAVPKPARDLGVVWPAGALNRVQRGWGMIYASAVRGRLLASATGRELARAEAAGEPWEALNAQEVYSVPALRVVADQFGIPLVLTLHGYPLYESDSEGYTAASDFGRRYLMGAEMRALRLADAVVTVDTRLHNHVVRLVPERADSVFALMNFIDTSSFFPRGEGREEARRAWGVPEGRTVLFCPRRLVKKNGVVFPSLALATMPVEERRRFLLLHAGEGGEREAMERVVREHGLQDQVRLLGGQGRDAILKLYRLADIILVPSVRSENVEEATSLSALEAMACGRPLIAGAVGGLAEIVNDGETGLLVPDADAEALAAAIRRLAADPDLGARLAAAARDYVVENHSHLRAAASYAEIYARAAVAAGASGDGPMDRRAAAAVSGDVPADASRGWWPTADGARAPWPTVSVLGFPLHRVDVEEAGAWLLAEARQTPPIAARGVGPSTPGPCRIAVSFNPELVMRALDDPAAAEAVLDADLCFPDGVGAVWAAGRQGVAGLTRVPGIELAERLLAGAAQEGLPVYLLGAAEGVADEAAQRLAECLPGLSVAGMGHGYFGPDDEDAVVAAVRGSGARVLLVALGAPRQEVFLRRHRHELGAAVALGVGGSFDVWAGRVSRAPDWTQRLRVEWLYRLASDPRRVRRQLALPRFAARVMAGCADDYGPGRDRSRRAAGGGRTPPAPPPEA